MRDVCRSLALLVLILLLPIGPFLIWGDWFETLGRRWMLEPPPPAVTAALAVGLLAGDILLPVPSSLVNTLAGSQLGGGLGTLVCWFGMNLSAVAGFALSRYFGLPLARRLSPPEHLERLRQLGAHYGPAILIAFRGVPVLAEATVLLAGVQRLSWRRFLPPVLLSNLAIAFAYAWFGQFAAGRQWLPLALGISLAVPLVLSLTIRNCLVRIPGKPCE